MIKTNKETFTNKPSYPLNKTRDNWKGRQENLKSTSDSDILKHLQS